MLSPYRVLDLTTERGLLCGQILGALSMESSVSGHDPSAAVLFEHREGDREIQPVVEREENWL